MLYASQYFTQFTEKGDGEKCFFAISKRSWEASYLILFVLLTMIVNSVLKLDLVQLWNIYSWYILLFTFGSKLKP